MADDDVRPNLDDDWFRGADAYQGDQLVRKGEPAPANIEPAVAVPVDASGSATAVALRTLAFQVIGLAGALVALLGLPDTSYLASAVRFLKREDVVPIIGLACAAIASAWQVLRGLKKHKGVQVLSLLLPQQVAKSPLHPSPAVVAAAEAAIVAIESPAAPVPPASTGEVR